MLQARCRKVIFKGDFDRVTFALKLARKDLGLATELAREHNVPMPLASMVEQDLLEAMAHGLGDKDSTRGVDRPGRSRGRQSARLSRNLNNHWRYSDSLQLTLRRKYRHGR